MWIDGLYFHHGNLIGIQNGGKPNRVVRLALSADGSRVERLDVLESGTPLLTEPTLGVLVGDAFYYVANAQWGSVDDKGQLQPPEKLEEPVILRVTP